MAEQLPAAPSRADRRSQRGILHRAPTQDMVPLPFGMPGASSVMSRSSVIGDNNDDYYNDTDSEEQRSVDYRWLSSSSSTAPLLAQQQYTVPTAAQLSSAQPQYTVPTAAQLSLAQQQFAVPPTGPLLQSAVPFTAAQLSTAQQQYTLPLPAAPPLVQQQQPFTVPPAPPLFVPQQQFTHPFAIGGPCAAQCAGGLQGSPGQHPDQRPRVVPPPQPAVSPPTQHPPQPAVSPPTQHPPQPAVSSPTQHSPQPAVSSPTQHSPQPATPPVARVLPMTSMTSTSPLVGHSGANSSLDTLGNKKYRSGQPPAAPPLDLTFQQASQNPMLFRMWMRKIEGWRLRARHWVPDNEMGLLLLEALHGDAAIIVQEEGIDRIAQDDGVDYLLTRLRTLEEKQIQSLGGAMRLYENLKRNPGEGVRSFVARWLAAEAHLSRLGLSVYVGEARAHKFLNSCNLASHDYRMILTATSNVYDFDKLRQALEVQYPIHPPTDRARPTPKGPGKGNQPKRVHITEDGSEWVDPAQASEQPESSAPADDPDAAVAQLAEVLSVTAQKLKSFTQARGWMQKGEKGKSKGKGDGKSKDKNKNTQYTPKQPAAPTSAATPAPRQQTPAAPYRPPLPSTGSVRPPVSTHVTAVENEWEQSIEEYLQEPVQEWYAEGEEWYEEPQEYAQEYAAMVTYSIPSISMDETWSTLWQHQPTTSFAAILDTACQRSVCGQKWLRMAPEQISILTKAEKEVFKFGVGQDVSTQRLAVAAALAPDSTVPDFTVHFSLVAADIPYLWSRQNMQAVGLVLDLGAARATFTLVPGRPCVDLQVVNGHLGLRLHPLEHYLQEPDTVHDLTLMDTTASVMTTIHSQPPIMKPAHITEDYRRAAQHLLGCKIPKTGSRSYLDYDQHGVRSLTFGGYTQRGVGITAVTREQPMILEQILVIARSRPPDMRMPFLAATLTAHISAPHVDSNYGVSQTIALGSLAPRAGMLVINNQEYANLNQWVQFDARVQHHVTALAPGDHRLALTLYVPRHPGKLSTEHLEELSQLGFPVRAWQATQKWRPNQPLLPPRLGGANVATPPHSQ
eukprot:6490540-Amphidinium_carterae.1